MSKEKALKLINEYLAKQEPQKVELADDIQRLLSYAKGIENFGKNIDISLDLIEKSLRSLKVDSEDLKGDLNRVNKLLKQIDLYDHIYKLPNNIHELAGENGTKLSGGQCQRLGIVRALYRNPSVIILDEATSSLDEQTEELIINGADVVKIGIGPGSVCTTRTMTGVGVPQFSAIVDCSDAANGVGGHIMADGGCVYPGDIAKAFGGGAHMVMIGGMLAGHDESEQPVVDDRIEFYGMSSDRAREVHGKRKDGYRGNEGRLISLPHRGPVEPTLEDILGGVRSACTYIGARRLKDMAKCASFVTTNNVINRVYERYTK